VRAARPPADPDGPVRPSAPDPTEARARPGSLPTRDELTLAWGDHILSSLAPRVRSRFVSGRWVAVEDGVALFALPGRIHAAKCEEYRADVEEALARHFGRPVPVRVVDDGTRGPGPASGGVPPSGGGRAEEPDPPEVTDVHELEDATDVAASGVDRIARMFPGAELVEGG
jgi:hypothetical protein